MSEPTQLNHTVDRVDVGENSMVTITLTPQLEEAAIAEAKRAGVSPQDFVLQVLRTKLLASKGSDSP